MDCGATIGGAAIAIACAAIPPPDPDMDSDNRSVCGGFCWALLEAAGAWTVGFLGGALNLFEGVCVRVKRGDAAGNL